ncbi:MAG: MFS transporter [Flavobacteriaceae bacterium]|nr:MFS transporter [Flavobacteriaceae bacterium]
MLENFLKQPQRKPEITDKAVVDSKYKKYRWQVFIGIFIGYAGYYLVRKNFSLAIPHLVEDFGFTKGDLGVVLSMNAIAYGFAKFIMASISDRSNAQRFLPLGLVLASLSMMFMIVPIQWLGAEHKSMAIVLMAVLNFLVGWFNGMGWPPCGRVMTQWFSVKERGTWMSVWNCAHNVGGALVGPMAVYGSLWFGSWFYGTDQTKFFLVGAYIFPASVAMLIAVMAYLLIKDRPHAVGLPSIERWSGECSRHYSEKSEETLSSKEIFKIVLSNKFLWYIAFANAFVYMVRYGCLDWAPTILKEQGFNFKDAGWAYFAYEIAAIPGTLVCGWLSDKIFKGRRALPTIIFMLIVMLFVILYWQFINNPNIAIASLIGIGFFIYGPVMLIGVQALDLAPKNAAGTAAGLTGFLGYVLGTAVLANMLIGYVAQNFGWEATFILLIGACLLSIIFMALTYKEEEENKNSI